MGAARDIQFNLADLLERVADTVPDHLALVCAERRLTYAELDARANRLAHVLAARGVGVGDHVALYLYNSTEYLEGMLAAFKLRAVPINVNYRYVEDELHYLLDDAEAVAVIFHREFASKLEAIRPRLPRLRDRVEAEPDQLAEVQAVLAAVEAELWAEADGAFVSCERSRLDAFALSAFSPIDAALHRLGV